MNIQKEICASQAPDIQELWASQALNIQEIWECSGDSCLIDPLKAQECKKKVLENSVTEFVVQELSRVKSPGIFCSSRKKSWNFLKKIFLEFREKMEFLEFSGPRIFLSWNVPSGNFLSRDFVSRKILAFHISQVGVSEFLAIIFLQGLVHVKPLFLPIIPSPL